MIIKTSAGRHIMIDEADWPVLSQYSWRLIAGGYAIASEKKVHPGARRKHIYMHRLLMGLVHGDGLQVDHVNGVKFDNRRSNLRICSPEENNFNAKRRSHNRSGFKGVIPATRPGRWDAYIRCNRKSIYLGRFSTPEEAHAAYCRAAKLLAKNFMNPG